MSVLCNYVSWNFSASHPEAATAKSHRHLQSGGLLAGGRVPKESQCPRQREHCVLIASGTQSPAALRRHLYPWGTHLTILVSKGKVLVVLGTGKVHFKYVYSCT